MAKETLAEKQFRIKESAIIWAESLYAYKLICRAIGITEETMIKWRKDDQDFSDRLEMSRVKFLNRNMRKAKPEFLLERLELEHFKQRTESDVRVELPSPILGGASVKDKDGSQ